MIKLCKFLPNSFHLTLKGKSIFLRGIKRHGSNDVLPRSPYHVLDPSPWPILMAVGLWGVAITFICWANGVPCNFLLLGAVVAAIVVYG